MKDKATMKSSLFAFCLMLTLVLTNAPFIKAQLICQNPSAPVVNTGAITTSDPTQTNRVFRSGVPSGCAGRLAGGAPLTGTYRYDSYNFTNTTGQAACVTVQIDTACAGTNFIFVTAYSTFDPANVNNNVLGTGGSSPSGTAPAFFSFPVAAGASYTIVVAEVTANAGCPAYTLTTTTRTSCDQAGFDRDGNGSADFAVYRPAALSQWLNRPSPTGTVETRQFGVTGDIPVPGDYTGDGQTDLAVYRPSNSTFYYGLNQTTPTTNFATFPFGSAGDIPVPGDYDRDGRYDYAVFRPSNGTFYIQRSATNTLFAQQWGQNGDIPVAGDFDGDLAGDLAVVRDVGGNYVWYILRSGTSYSTFTTNRWGLTGDKLAPTDYDGDGASDIGIWRPSTGTFSWMQTTFTATATTTMNAGVQWGASGDIPQPADYNGDKRQDFAVYRPSTSTFYVLQSGTNSFVATQLGQSGDQPVTAPHRIQ